jgi:HrpA-like RNA helicase
MCSLVAMLSEAGQVFKRPRKDGPAADKAHEKLHARTGDHLTLLAVFDAYSKVPAPKKRIWCEQNFLDFRFLKRARKNRRALAKLLTRLHTELLSVDNVDNREMSILKSAPLLFVHADRNDDQAVR